MAPYFLKAADWKAIFDIYNDIRQDQYSAMTYIFSMIDDNNIELAYDRRCYNIVDGIPTEKYTKQGLFDALEKEKINVVKTNLFKGSILMSENMFVSLSKDNALERIITYFAEQGYDLKQSIYNLCMNKPDVMEEMYIHHLEKGSFSFEDSQKVFGNLLKKSIKELKKLKSRDYFSNHDSYIQQHLNILYICSQHYEKLDKAVCIDYFNDFMTVFTTVLPQHLQKFNDVKDFFIKHNNSLSAQIKSPKAVTTHACESFIIRIDTNQIAYQIKQEIEHVKSKMEEFYKFIENCDDTYRQTIISLVSGTFSYGSSSDNVLDICIVVKPDNPGLKDKIELLFEQVHYHLHNNTELDMKKLWKKIHLYYDIDSSLDKKTIPNKTRAKI